MADGIWQADYREQAKAWYKSKAWQRLRAHQLSKHPYCQCPHHMGQDKTAVATIADHVTPHRGDKRKFFSAPLQSLAKQCHDRGKQSQERGGRGFDYGSDSQGNPLAGAEAWWR